MAFQIELAYESIAGLAFHFIVALLPGVAVEFFTRAEQLLAMGQRAFESFRANMAFREFVVVICLDVKVLLESANDGLLMQAANAIELGPFLLRAEVVKRASHVRAGRRLKVQQEGDD